VRMSVAAAIVVAMTVLVHRGPTVRRRLVSVAPAGSRDGRPRPALAIVVVALAVGVVAIGRGPAGALDLLGAGAVVVVVGWLVRARRAERTRSRRHDAVIGLCGALAAELQAGLAAETALARACADWPDFGPVERVARLGGDITSAFGSLAARPGFESLRAVAAGWAVAERSGASLAAVLDRIGDGLRDQRAARAEVESALEPPRATARMLAVLPLFGILLGTAMGAGPLSFLIGTPAGRVCLMVGALLALAGIAWVERLARAVAGSA
jgi:tight adherence protein B